MQWGFNRFRVRVGYCVGSRSEVQNVVIVGDWHGAVVAGVSVVQPSKTWDLLHMVLLEC